MSATPQSQAVSLANTILSIDAQIASLFAQANQVIALWSDTGAEAVVNALPTAALNADGTLGTADGTPNTAHVIDTRVVTALTRAISAADVGALKLYVLGNFVSMCNGTAIGVLPAMRQLINKAQGG